MAPTLAITGATGFIGSAIARELHGRSWQVRALLRSPSKRTRLPLDVTCVPGELHDELVLRELIRGADVIVHCAGIVRGAHEAEFHRVNAAATALLVQLAAEQEPAPHFVLISSLAARRPDLSPYASSKRRAEELLARYAAAMRWTVFRPPAVYGPGDTEVLPLFKSMQRGWVPSLNRGVGRFSMLYVDDLAAAVAQSLQIGNASGEVFELADGTAGGYTWEEVIDTASRLFGRRIRSWEIPPVLVDSIATVNLYGGRLFAYHPMLTPWKLRELRYPDWVCDNAAISAALSWKPLIGLAQGLRLTLGLSENG